MPLAFAVTVGNVVLPFTAHTDALGCVETDIVEVKSLSNETVLEVEPNVDTVAVFVWLVTPLYTQTTFHVPKDGTVIFPVFCLEKDIPSFVAVIVAPEGAETLIYATPPEVILKIINPPHIRLNAVVKLPNSFVSG